MKTIRLLSAVSNRPRLIPNTVTKASSTGKEPACKSVKVQKFKCAKI